MDGNALTIEQEVSRWPGVTTAPGRFDAVAFRYVKREIGHLHRDRIADLPVTSEMRDTKSDCTIGYYAKDYKA